MAKTHSLKFMRTISAEPALVYRAFTQSGPLREWFCDTAALEARPAGRVYFAWRGGHYVSGEFTRLEPGRKIGFTWLGRGEPAASQVRISLSDKKGGTTVTVTHDGVGTGKKWGDSGARIARGWEAALDNLQSTQETGFDLRITQQPMLGVGGLEDVTAESAKRLGAPVKRGVRITSLVPGMGAEAAGLQPDDIIVSLDGRKVPNTGDVLGVLQSHRAGDILPMTFYRGADKHTADLALSHRPLPEVPAAPADLAEAVRAIYAQMDKKMAVCFKGVSAVQANQQPADGEWSANQALAHLVQEERDKLLWLGDMAAGGGERYYETYPGNCLERVQATVQALGTSAALLEALRRLERETVALLAALPPSLVARRAGYWRAGQVFLQGAHHVQEHMAQIRDAIAAAQPKQETVG